MRSMTCASEPGRGAQSPYSLLIRTKYCCWNAPLLRPSSDWSTILHWPNTSSKPLLVNEPVKPQRMLILSMTLFSALNRAPDGFFSLVNSS